ncbi:MAG: hypothetical protein ACK57T_07225 [Dolichospermum sp.]
MEKTVIKITKLVVLYLINLCSLFPVPCNLFPVTCSLFPVPCSLVITTIFNATYLTMNKKVGSHSKSYHYNKFSHHTGF